MFKEKGLFIEILETVGVSFVVIFLLYAFVAFPTLVWGVSMEPSFHTGERVLVEKITKHIGGFHRGDVVVLHPPQEDSVDYIKRIIGLPGDIIKVLECNVYISTNGEKFKLVEPYLTPGTCTYAGVTIREGRALRIPEGQYMVFGDNRTRSRDSRTFGFVAGNRILGKVVVRFWPIDKVAFI